MVTRTSEVSSQLKMVNCLQRSLCFVNKTSVVKWSKSFPFIPIIIRRAWWSDRWIWTRFCWKADRPCRDSSIHQRIWEGQGFRDVENHVQSRPETAVTLQKSSFPSSRKERSEQCMLFRLIIINLKWLWKTSCLR